MGLLQQFTCMPPIPIKSPVIEGNAMIYEFNIYYKNKDEHFTRKIEVGFSTDIEVARQFDSLTHKQILNIINLFEGDDKIVHDDSNTFEIKLNTWTTNGIDSFMLSQWSKGTFEGKRKK